MKVIYPELVGGLAKRSITKSTVAATIGVSPRTLYSKLVGDTDFTLSEASAIQRCFFPDIEMHELFQRADDPGA